MYIAAQALTIKYKPFTKFILRYCNFLFLMALHYWKNFLLKLVDIHHTSHVEKEKR